MDVTRVESLIAVKFDSDGRSLVERAANAVIIAWAKDATTETDPARVAEVNANILSVGALVKRIKDNRAPVYMTPVEEGLAVSMGEEGSTVFHEDEVDLLGSVLRHYSDATVTAVPHHTGGGGLNTSAWQRAFYGYDAGVMAETLNSHLTPQIGE